ncbi:uncharacterized protein LOC107820657 [Nicotiana tabacum]|uniref:Uncharacterized protein LOC107820657 n=2 Tax=Nicotiana tabacum TaxID=4097 RepID=A0AC58SSL5_TOBAC
MLTASTTMSAPTLPIVRAEAECLKQFKPIVSVGLQPLGMQSQFINNGRHLICPVQEKSASIICVAALSARCATKGQMQTLTRENSTITVAPEKVKSPDLDDGGAGFPPRDDDGSVWWRGGGDGGWGGGGGDGGEGRWAGGGGGGHWAFFFFVFLVILGFLKDKEEEGPYQDQRRRKPVY